MIYRIIIYYRILPNSALPNRDLPHSTLPNFNHDLSNSSCSSLLPILNFYSFPLTSIHHVIGIDFTYHYHLHFRMHQWIISLILLLKLLISSFRLECFCPFSRCDFSTCLGLRRFLAMLNKYFPSWHVFAYNLSSSTIGNKRSCYRSLIHGSSL